MKTSLSKSNFLAGRRLILTGVLSISVTIFSPQVRSMTPDAMSPDPSPSDAMPPDAMPQNPSLLEEGRRLYALDRYTEALPLLVQAVKLDGKSSRAQYWLGMTLYALNRNDEALEAFKQVVRRDRFWAPGHMGLGLTNMRVPNRRLDARKAMREAIKLDPGNAEYQYALGMTYMDQGEESWLIGSHQDGRDFFQRAVELDPLHPDAHFQLGRCYEELKLSDQHMQVRDRYDDYVKALNSYLLQYQVNPEHPEALQRFAGVCHRFEYYERGAEQLRKMAEEMEGISSDLIQTLLTQFEALSMSTKKQYDLLQRSLETYVNALDLEEQAVYRDLVHVATNEELKAWRSAEGKEREDLWTEFWNARDSNPATIENERLVEHYKRVMYARIHFSDTQFPYDRRGEVYVRFGEPDDRQRFLYRANEDPRNLYPPTGKPEVDEIREMNWQFGYRLKVDPGQVAVLLDRDVAQRVGFGAESILTADNLSAEPFANKKIDQVNYETAVIQRRSMGSTYRAESWVYVTHDMELFFVDPTGGGRFDYPQRTLQVDAGSSTIAALGEMRRDVTLHPMKVADRLIEQTPEEYEHDFAGEPLDYAFDAVTFRGDGIRTEVELSYSIPVWQFGDTSDGKGLVTYLSNQATLRNDESSPVFNQRFRFGPIERPTRRLSPDQARVSTYTLAVDVRAPQGVFTAWVDMRDEASQRVGVYSKQVNIRDYRGGALMISDLKLSTGITRTDRTGPFVRNGLNIVPHPLRVYGRGQLVYVYYEVYNLDLGEASGRTSYETQYEIVPEGTPARPFRPSRQLEDMQTVLLTFEGEGSSREEAEFTAMDTTNLTPGVYVLTVTFVDRHSGESVSESASFIISGE
ncbi:MAG: tetratricopeptide repeat protein [Gemmatimonadetes bacterium]|nr:tetratricopeptide repeat protein [Gemmatimonadota bacterium]MYB62078.1 tetratricopeptide repeat protein [Gemmatimonadota bacterium]